MKKKAGNSGKHHTRSNPRSIWILCLAALAIVAAMLLWAWWPGSVHSAMDGRFVYEGEEMEDEEISFGDGDSLLRPGADALRYDEESGMVYFDGMLFVFLDSELSDEELEAMASSVGGEIVGSVKGDASYLQIQTDETDFSKLNELAEQLMENEEHVLYARYDYPVTIESSLSGHDTNPWKSSGSNGSDYDEAASDGNNWWAEAIDAYTAWQYTDQCEDYTIGIVDSGFDFDHEDLDGKISVLAGTKSGEGDHGTHVAGIIGAKNNEVGIRGIADTANLLVADWSQEKNGVNYITSGEVLAIMSKMVSQGALTVNNSWSDNVMPSYLKYLLSLTGIVNGISKSNYEKYIDTLKEHAAQTGLDAMMMVNQLIMSGRDQFIIVQSAGNGYTGLFSFGTELWNGYDTKWNSYFCSMEQWKDKYESTIQRFYEKVNRSSASYDEIREHVMIVGAVQNERNSSGQYKIFSKDFLFVHGSFNYGDDIDLYAPGIAVYSSITNSSYENMDGTSMAAPMVAASAAMLWALEPDLTVSEVRSYLLDNAGGAYDLDGNVFKMLNIGNAVEALMHTDRSDLDAEDANEENQTDSEKSDGTLSDTSTGTYRMSGVAERDGILYYINNAYAKSQGYGAEEEIIYRLDPLSGEEDVFVTGDDDRHICDLLATEQYLYVKIQHTAQYNVEVYDYDGNQVGELRDVEGDYIYFDGGYLYYETGNAIYRVPVSEGAVTLEDSENRTKDKERRISPEGDTLDDGFLIIEDFLYYWTSYEEELVRLSMDGNSRETLSTDLSGEGDAYFAYLGTNDESVVYGGRVIGMTNNQTPTIYYSMQLSGVSTVQDQILFQGDTSDAGTVEQLMEGGGAGTYKEGYVVGNIYVYLHYGRDEFGKYYNEINGVNLDTGESFTIKKEEYDSNRTMELVYVPGQSRVYYSIRVGGTIENSTEYRCVEVYGGINHVVYELPDTIRNAFSVQYYQYDY